MRTSSPEDRRRDEDDEEGDREDGTDGWRGWDEAWETTETDPESRRPARIPTSLMKINGQTKRQQKAKRKRQKRLATLGWKCNHVHV